MSSISSPWRTGGRSERLVRRLSGRQLRHRCAHIQRSQIHVHHSTTRGRSACCGCRGARPAVRDREIQRDPKTMLGTGVVKQYPSARQVAGDHRRRGDPAESGAILDILSRTTAAEDAAGAGKQHTSSRILHKYRDRAGSARSPRRRDHRDCRRDESLSDAGAHVFGSRWYSRSRRQPSSSSSHSTRCDRELLR